MYNTVCDVCGGTVNLQIDGFRLVLNFKHVALLQGNMVCFFSIPGAETLWPVCILEQK